jgi:hypothetical protein
MSANSLFKVSAGVENNNSTPDQILDELEECYNEFFAPKCWSPYYQVENGWHTRGLKLISFIAKGDFIIIKQCRGLNSERLNFCTSHDNFRSDHSSSNNIDKVFDKANICLNYCNKERPSIEYAGRTWRSLKEEVDQKQKKLNENL